MNAVNLYAMNAGLTDMAAGIHEIKGMHNRSMVFSDRAEAGRALGDMLVPYLAGSPDAIILAIPSGGVPVGIEISDILHIPFDVVIVRKINIPGNTEAGFGALALEGGIFINEPLFTQLHLKPGELEELVSRVRKELRDRERLFRGGRAFPDLTGKTIILVDDGLASGYTMIAAINMVKEKGAGKIMVAVPTAPMNTIRLITPLVDEIFCPNIREGRYFAVAEAYKRWYDLDREEVVRLLKEKWKISEP
jgi:putative phosphoribosyl transferase